MSGTAKTSVVPAKAGTSGKRDSCFRGNDENGVEHAQKTSFLFAPLAIALLAACSPKVQIEAPDKPIEINLNVNIEHHVKVEIEKDLDSAMNKHSDIF